MVSNGVKRGRRPRPSKELGRGWYAKHAGGSPRYKVKVQLFQVDSMHLNDLQNVVTTSFVPIGNFLQT